MGGAPLRVYLRVNGGIDDVALGCRCSFAKSSTARFRIRVQRGNRGTCPEGCGEGDKRMLVGVENFFLEDFQEPHILGVSGFMGANVPADGSAE